MTSNPVSWTSPAATSAGGVGWTPSPRPALPLAALARLLAGGLTGLAGALVLGGTFPTLLSIDDNGLEYRQSGWSVEHAGDPTADTLLLGIPLTVGAVGLLAAAALVLASVWRPGLRAVALAVTVGAAALVTAEFWTAGSYLSDALDVAREADLDGFSASRGAGYWLLLAGTVVALLALAALGAAEAAGLRRPAVPPAPAPPPPWAAAAPVAGPPDWATETDTWGGAR
ncbi:hypothetical protein [Geodermatophilus sp. SYSU D00815]